MLEDEIVLLTGKLDLFTRDLAHELVGMAGGEWVTSASRKVTMLVVGTQNKNVLRGHDKSTKHREIEQLIESGEEIGILSDRDFYELCGIVVEGDE